MLASLEFTLMNKNGYSRRFRRQAELVQVVTALRTIRRVSAMGCALELAASTELDLDPHLDGCCVYDRNFVDALPKLGKPSQSRALRTSAKLPFKRSYMRRSKRRPRGPRNHQCANYR
jgi:hypothetical protein